MGNRQSNKTSDLKEVIEQGNLNRLQEFLDDLEDPQVLQLPLNKMGDTAVLLAARQRQFAVVKQLLKHVDLNKTNHIGESVLDLWLSHELPSDGDILHQHFCPHQDNPFVVSEEACFLLKQGAIGLGLQRLILHSFSNKSLIKQIIASIPDITSPQLFRFSGLLLQATVWFDQLDHFSFLLVQGVNVLNFWRAPFTPALRNLIDLDFDFVETSQQARHVCRDEGHWSPGSSIAAMKSSYNEDFQNLKLTFIEDWRADWNEGLNPEAEFRAGLHVTPSADH